MPGKLCNGTNDAILARQSKAYCQGRSDAKNGVLVGANPFPPGPTFDDWVRGHESWFNPDPSTLTNTRDCCDTPIGGGWTPPP